MDFTNTLYTHDNLYILYGMNSDLVDLIYLDPPFNSKRMYSAPVGSKAAGASFKDMWTWQDIDEYYLDSLAEKYPALSKYIASVGEMHSKGMQAYLTYMTQRIIELYRILKETGSLYFHCDSTASHYVKNMLDAVFGKNNFRNEIIWERMVGAKGSQFRPRKFGSSSDTILFYTKSENYHFDIYKARTMTEKDRMIKFPLVDENGKRYYDDSAHIWRNPSMGDRPNLCYEWRGFRNPHPSGWRLSKEKMEEEYQKGNIVIRPDGKLERRKYEDDYRGVSINNVWTDIKIVRGKESTGYPTQKPLALLHRIIKASTKKGDIVLDPFCGCATTCVASQQLGRKWIGIDIEKQASRVLIERLSDDAGLFKDFINTEIIPVRTDVKFIQPTLNVKEQLYSEQNRKCNGCGIEFEIWNLEIDHKIPRSKGGGDYYENYQLLCGSCNKIKGNRPMDYLRLKIETREKMMTNKIMFGE